VIRKNVGSQIIYAVLVNRTTGEDITSSATIHINGSSGGGSLAHVAGGLWSYTLTQAETNHDSFGYRFGHASGVSVGGTILTVDYPRNAIPNAAAGSADGLSTHTAADVWAAGTRTLTAGTNIQLPSNGLANVTAWTVAITGNITGNLSGSVGSVTGAVGSVTGNVGGNVTGSVGSISGVTFPSNFASLSINSSGHVSRVVLCDTTTTNTDMLTAAGIRTAVGLADEGNLLDVQLTSIAASASNASSQAQAASVRLGAFDISDSVKARLDAGVHLKADGLDLIVVETGLNARQALSINAAALAGVLAGAATNTITVTGAGVATNRLTASVDEDGNRSAVTLSPPA
jgi:hypothetical protein